MLNVTYIKSISLYKRDNAHTHTHTDLHVYVIQVIKLSNIINNHNTTDPLPTSKYLPVNYTCINYISN